MDGSARRVLVETRRHLQRPGTLRVLLGAVAFMGLMGWLGLHEEGIELPLSFTYYLLPLLMCPYAAHRVLADRDEGIGEVGATTPLSRREALAATVLATFLVPVVAVGATVPVLYGVAPPGAPGAFWTLLAHVPWALSIGWAAGGAGLLAGHLTPHHPRLGVGFAFALIPLWFVTGVSLNDAADPGLVVELFSKLSPVTYWDSMWVTHPVPTGPPELLLGPLLLTGLALGVLVPVALSLQDVSGWARPLRRHPLALAVVTGVLVLGTGALLAWEVPPDETPGQGYPVEGDRAGLHFSIVPRLVGHPFPAWEEQTPVQMTIEVLGPPNATVELRRMHVTSPKIDFAPEGPTERVLVLDRVFEDDREVWNKTGGPAGFNRTTLNLTATPTELFAKAPARVSFQVDGEPVAFDVSFSGLSWELDGRRIAGATAAVLAPLAVAAWRLPSRWNRW